MSAPLSTHFDLMEFQKDGPIPSDCIDIFKELCADILEPIREWLARPMTITSGYRPPSVNAAIHGAPHSEHVATPKYCAADFSFDTIVPTVVSVRACFDWIRTNQTIPFHQVILEHGSGGSSIIHISIDLDKWGQRQALEGATYNQTAYSSHDVAPFAPAQQENA